MACPQYLHGKVLKSNRTDDESAKMSTGKGVIRGYSGSAAVDDRHPCARRAATLPQPRQPEDAGAVPRLRASNPGAAFLRPPPLPASREPAQNRRRARANRAHLAAFGPACRNGRLDAADPAPAAANQARCRGSSKKIFASALRIPRRSRAGLVQQTVQIVASAI